MGFSQTGNRLDSLLAIGYSLPATSFTYDTASRLDTVTSGTRTVTYGYVPNSPLVGTITFKDSGTTRVTTAKSYDNLNRLGSTSHTPSVSSVFSVGYEYNSANQRTKAVRQDNTYWNYGYDALGQVTSGKKHLADTTPINGLDFGWTYDDIGNRKTSTTNSQITQYTPNVLNQYAQRTVAGVVDVFGAATPSSTVTVALNGSTPLPTTRQGEFFFKQLSVENSVAAQYPSLKITGVKNLVGANGEDAVTEITKTTYLPKTPEAFAYDADGNLTDDARWHYVWDAENRLKSLESSTAAIALGVTPLKLEYSYDGQGRRFAKNVYNWNGTVWVLGTSTLFLHDGWNLLAELNALNSNAVVSTYVWGTDLSGSSQGAGGVGGLLFSNIGSATHTSAFDGNGNVIGLVDMATGIKSATYDYNAFGETIQSDGVASAANHFRFSTKYTDDETGLYYYGYRFYQPSTGRWLSRDPIEEQGGVNVYEFVWNDPIGQIDLLGRDPVTTTVVVGGATYSQIVAGGSGIAWGAPAIEIGATGVGAVVVAGGAVGYGIGTGINNIPRIWGGDRISDSIANSIVSPSSFPIRTREPAVYTPPGGTDGKRTADWINAGRDSEEVRRRLDKAKRCIAIHFGYKNAQGAASKMREKKKLCEMTCEELKNLLRLLNMENDGRQKYIFEDCDSVPWNPPPSADHPGELRNNKAETTRVLEFAKAKGCL